MVVVVVVVRIVVRVVVRIVVVARDARIDDYDEEDAAGDGDARGGRRARADDARDGRERRVHARADLGRERAGGDVRRVGVVSSGDARRVRDVRRRRREVSRV